MVLIFELPTFLSPVSKDIIFARRPKWKVR
jgi:hypothetical protein